MKQYRVMSRDVEYQNRQWFDWGIVWYNKEDPQEAIDCNKETDVASAYDPDMTEYKIQEREISKWRDV